MKLAMIRFKNELGWVVATLFVAVAMVGCGAEPSAGGTSSELLMAESLGTLDGATWASAAAGCEGHLGGDVIFAIASADAGLVAAVDEDGEVVCVDTVEAVEEELQETGRDEEADNLVDAFAATVARATHTDTTGTLFDGPNQEGDPDPEPNIGDNRFRYAGDPDPEPNMGS